MQLPLHDDAVRPDTLPYRPASHGPLHDALGNALLLPYSPALQLTHAVHPLALYSPAGHVTAVGDVDVLLGHTYPALQFVHMASPAYEYWPGRHTNIVALVFTDPAGHA